MKNRNFILFIMLFFPVSLTLFTGCRNTQKKKGKTTVVYFYVGTYTGNGSEGIYLYKQHGDSLKRVRLSDKTVNPSFLTITPDKRFLLAVNETMPTGSVSVYALHQRKLQFLNKRSSYGGAPCFVSVNRKGFVLVANYSSGNVSLFHLSPKGMLSSKWDVQQDSGHGILSQQKGPHAHQSVFEPNSNRIITVDLGANALFFSTIDTLRKKLVPVFPFEKKMRPGDGPRHLAFHPNGKWMYVVSELSSTVTLWLRTENGDYLRGKAYSTLPGNYNKTSYCAEIKISSDGHFLYASNRGHNSIAIFKINIENGSLQRIALINVHGNWPRYFTFSPDENYLLVANQKSNNLVLFKRNPETGLLQYVSQITAPHPVCIVYN